ncbi:MAG: HRDC domain-containing protein [Elusimicrobia bacterium]|nr:HRDC domain-containing protein [Elusimicrobiota bacterium]
MKLKVFTLRLNSGTGRFDESGLDEFQLGKDVIEATEHFIVHERAPTLILVVRYREVAENLRASSEAPRKDWRGELDPAGQRIYDEMRLWRGRTAKREGMPPYLILNNRELAELAMKRPVSLAQLREINGIGEAKSQRWGEEMLAVLAKLGAAAAGSEVENLVENRGGGGVILRGFCRFTAFHPLGEDPQGYPLAYRKIPQARPLHHFFAHR